MFIDYAALAGAITSTEELFILHGDGQFVQCVFRIVHREGPTTLLFTNYKLQRTLEVPAQEVANAHKLCELRELYLIHANIQLKTDKQF